MEEKDRPEITLGRDLCNEHWNPLRDKYEELKKIQDIMNKQVNLFMDPPPVPPTPPEPPIPEVRHKYFHLDALGLFLDVLEHGYLDEEGTFSRIEAVLKEAVKYGVSAISYFAWLDDNKAEHANLRRKIPWVIEGTINKKCNFERLDSQYWYLHRRFMTLLKKYNIQPIPQAFMWKYTFYWFENNKNDVNSFYAGNALRYQKWMAWRLCMEQKRLGFSPQLKFVNEAAHHGRCGGLGGGHWIANWHRDMYTHVQSLVPMERMIIDVSESEFALAQLVWHSGSNLCSKCNAYEWDNIKSYDRNIIPEYHGVSIKDDLERDYKSFEAFIKNLFNWHMKGSEDGSRYGNIRPIPDLNLRYGDANQVHAMLKHAWGECKKSNKKKEFYWGIYPMECLRIKDGVFEDLYSVDRIDWSRFAAADRAHREVFGE